MASGSLAALYQSSGGSSWSGSRDNWLGDDLCTYAGVDCAYADSGNACEDAATQAGCDVDSVELWAYGLTGSLPTELGMLTSARSIYLGPNNLEGTTPTQLALLTRLTYLNLRSNDLSGVVPTQLGELNRTLEYVALHQNALSGTMPTQLGRLGALTTLNAKTNTISGVLPSEMGGMRALASLVLQSNLLSGQLPSQIGALPLTSCGLDGTNAFECALPPLPPACSTSASSLCGAPQPPPPSTPSPSPSPPPSPDRPPASPPSAGPSEEDGAALAVSIVLVLMLACLCVVTLGCRFASKRQMRFAWRRPEPRGRGGSGSGGGAGGGGGGGDGGGGAAGKRRRPHGNEPTSPLEFRAVVVGDLGSPRRTRPPPRLPHESTILSTAPMDTPTPRGKPGSSGGAAAASAVAAAAVPGEGSPGEGPPGALAGLMCAQRQTSASSVSSASSFAEAADARPAEQRVRADTQTRVERQWADLPAEMPSALLLEELVAGMLRETDEGDEAAAKIRGFPPDIRWQLVKAHAHNRSPRPPAAAEGSEEAEAGAEAEAGEEAEAETPRVDVGGRDSLLSPGPGLLSPGPGLLSPGPGATVAPSFPPIVPPGQRSPLVLKVGQVPWLAPGASSSSTAMTMAEVNEKVAAAEAAVAAVATTVLKAEARRLVPTKGAS